MSNSNMGMEISLGAALSKNATPEMIQKLDTALREHIFRVRPDIAIDSKEMDKVIKNAFKKASYTLGWDDQISRISAGGNISPSQSFGGNFNWVPFQKAFTEVVTNATTGLPEKKEHAAVDAHWETEGIGFTVDAVANAKQYEKVAKRIENINKKIAEAQISGNKGAEKDLLKDKEKAIVKLQHWRDVMEKDATAEQNRINLSRTETIMRQSSYANENKLIVNGTKLINANMKEIEKLTVAKRSMNKGDASYNETVKQIRKLRKETNALRGTSFDKMMTPNIYNALDVAKKAAEEKMKANLAKSSASSDVSRYGTASKETLSLQRELSKLQEKMYKNRSDDSPENRKLVASLEAELAARKKIMDTIERTSKGKANENEITKKKNQHDKESDLIQQRIIANGAKTKNFLRDIITGWKKAAARVVDYTIAYRLLWGGVALFKAGIQTIYELNKAFTDIQMVTGMTRVEVNILADSYAKLAQNYGATIQQVAQGATEWLCVKVI